MDDVFDWRVKLRDIGAAGAAGSRVASAEECVEVARVLDIQACERVQVDYQVRPLRSGLYSLTGTLVADVVQACVVTLEPVRQRIDEVLDVELRPANAQSAESTADEDILSAPDVALLDNEEVNVGRIVLEQLSTAIDPYPRVPGAELDVQDAGEVANPFAALNKLKTKR